MRWLVVIAVIAACHGTAVQTATQGARLDSNVLRGDYAGSRACADCHDQIYKAWQASPMRNMTRDATTATIRGPFDGATLRVGTDTITMESERGARFMRIASPTGDTRWRITKVVGGRYREDFVGIDVTHATDALATPAGALEHVLPATFVFSNRSWRYKGYSVMVKERPHSSAAGVWSQECIGCHNTLPLATMLYDDLYGPTLPAYQGKMSDRVLPVTKVWAARARDAAGLASALVDEISYLGGTPPPNPVLNRVLPEVARTTEDKLDGAHLVELGVGCEACHNGSKVHAATPDVKPEFAATSPLLAIDPPAGEKGTRAQWINHTCAKCHTVLFTRYPYTWEDGARKAKDPGGSSTTSGEGRDFQLGGCATQMSCTTCHDPHAMDSPAKMAKMATPAGNGVCLTCHDKYKAPGAVEAHSHHKTGGTGTSCIACHMPKKNMGLDYALDRYHRIGSPNDPKRVEGDRPVECALCHADKTVDAMVTTMEAWWGKRYDRGALAKLYGKDLAVNALQATLVYGKPHEQAVAISVLGDAKDTTAVRNIAVQLAHDYPLVRYFAQRALQTITGDPVAIDVGAPAAEVRAATEAWLKARNL